MLTTGISTKFIADQVEEYGVRMISIIRMIMLMMIPIRIMNMMMVRKI